MIASEDELTSQDKMSLEGEAQGDEFEAGGAEGDFPGGPPEGYGLDEPDSDAEEAGAAAQAGGFDEDQEGDDVEGGDQGEEGYEGGGQDGDYQDGGSDAGRGQGAFGAVYSEDGSNPPGSAPGRGGYSEDGEAEDDAPFGNRLGRIISARSNSASSRSASRPGSAVINLRGSRPSSAAVAQEIEGFEDDFMERVEEEEEGEYDNDGEYEEEEEQDMGPTVEELIERGQQEQMRLQEVNEILQKRGRLALDFRNKGRPPVTRDSSMLDGVVTRYRSALKLWVDALEERDRVEGHYQSTIFDMKSMLEERIKRADDISKAYKHFKLEVAKSAEHSKTGRPISERLLGQMEHEDQEKEEEVQRVRLKNIHLTNQLKRIEQTLKQKEELAEGLHLIDFEQLKIENQSLNEKIEERNEELLKLRKKTTTTVQILTHVREKLQFVEKENGALSASLEELEQVRIGSGI